MLAKILPCAGGARPQPTFVSSRINGGSTAATTVTAPSGIQNGDLLVAVGFTGLAGYTVTPPSGFNVQHLDNASLSSLFIATKVASSESGNYTFTWSGANGNTVAVLVYRNATQVNTIGTSTKVTSATGTAASITPTYAGTLCAVFCAEDTATISTPPAGMTQRASRSGDFSTTAVYDLSGQTASATSAQSLVWSSSLALTSVQFFVTGEPNVTPTFVASASQQNTANSLSITINKPTGTIEGDLMIGVMSGDIASSRTWAATTGWTEIAAYTGTTALRVVYKVATASEPSNYTFSVTANAPLLSGSILTYRYAAYDTIAGSFTAGTDPMVFASISPSLSQARLIACGSRNSASITLGTPISMTARVTDNGANAPSYIVCDQQVAKGPTGTRSMSTGGTANVAGIMLAIKPTRSL